MKLVKIINLCKSYGKNIILKNLNLSLNSSFVYFLISANGSGKTTFFKCLLRETSFNGIIDDKNIIYSYLPDKVKIPSYVSVFEFLIMYLRIGYKEVDVNKINEYLRLFDILKYKYRFMHELSKGTKQKVLINKTLLSKADVYLLDEPLAGLDYKSRITFMMRLKALQEEGKIVVIATHYYNDYSFDNKKVIEIDENNQNT